MDASPESYPHVRWYTSLFFRVMLLCGILLGCLLGSVSQITSHYFHEVVQEMEIHTSEIASKVQLQLETNADVDFDTVKHKIEGAYDNQTDIELKPYTDNPEPRPFALEKDEEGQYVKMARVPLTIQGRHVLLTVRVKLVPQTEILRAFKNKYMIAMTLVFLFTLGVMMYFIARILRPISELSNACARISSGKLEDISMRKSASEVLAFEFTFNKMVASLREKEVVESNLRQAQRLSAIGNLAAGVAHDVRNPLNAIKLLSSHALDSVKDVPEAASAAKHLQTIRSEVNRLEEIVSGFLSLARERELCQEPYRIDTLLDECSRLIRKDAEDRGLRLIVELRAGDTSLMIDPKQMTRAVLNVLINAMDATPRDGRVRLFSRVTDTACEIEIRDEGRGIPKDIVERVFEPYYTTKPTGTGLGLSITRGIVEEHGGTIALSSTEGHGCQVLISLPLELKSP